MKKLVKVGAGLLSAMPLLAFAAPTGQNIGYITSLLDNATSILNKVVVLLIAFAVVWFIYNVVKYSMAGDEEGKEAAKQQMIWGIIALAVIISIWGLVNLLQSVFGVQEGTNSFNGSASNLLPK